MTITREQAFSIQKDLRMLEKVEKNVGDFLRVFEHRQDMITENRLAERFLVSVSRKRVITEMEALAAE